MLNNKVSKAVRLAIAFGAASTAAFSASSIAAEEGADKVERIQVTGSRISRTDMETSVPVTTYSLDDIKATGAPTLEQFVQQLPIISGGSYGSNVNNGGNGSVTMNLRGLGASRTLVLLNGRRFSGDISIIPMAAVARVDVLRDGASTIYGSDAIAGVVNFVTNNDYSGAEIEFRHQQTSENDGKTSNISFITGVETDKGNIVFSAGYEQRDAIYGEDRDWASCVRAEDITKENADGSVEGKVVCAGGSATTSPASFSIPGIVGKTFVKGADGKPRAIESADRYNYADTSIIYQPLEKYNLFGSANYELIDSGFSTVTFVSEASFTHRVNKTRLAPVGTFWSMPVPETNPGNTFGEKVFAQRRLTESEGRTSEFSITEYLITTGFEGEFSNGWYWDTSYSFNSRRRTEEIGGRIHQERANTLVDPELCSANAACPGVWDPFQKDSLTNDMRDWIIVPMSSTSKAEDTQLQFNIAGETSFELPAGTIAWATGYEHLTTHYTSLPDGAAGLGAIYGVAPDGTDGGYTTESFYAEINVPILADLPFAERLDFTAAARRTDVSLIDDAEVTTKFAIEWRPYSDLLVRANLSEGFRTPGVSTLFAPRANSAETYTDPCIKYGSNPDASAELKANCAADGLPGDWAQPNQQSGSWVGGNPDIGPEQSESKNLGVVWAPEFIEGFSVALDYYDIEITDIIGELSIGTISNECYNSKDFSSPLCAQIKGPVAYGTVGGPRRDSQGSLSGVELSTQNLGIFNSSGIDFDLKYGLDVLGGELKFNLNGTYVLELDHNEAEGLETTELLGGYGADVANGGRGAFNKLRANFRTNYSQGDWGLTHTIQYQSAVDDYAEPNGVLSDRVGTVAYNDINGYYNFEHLTLSLGINNISDKEPPYVSNGDNGALIRVHRLTGREYYLKATFKF
ncbi:TonB-dependent receptor [Pseudoalteromonas sp. SR44-5]|uniref:TonB-dependent receptor plug domain-containing protein n=1 Tax=unclassified Pseudoalteromonas TaxID=194690 RepID=UPI0015FF4CEA|nr:MULTISPECIES: TonB-dependent receptor [unclassified Pseudoalteromonas]MBB1334273.1 TonB-dependent receptor [Pseudoalteromonas sp. SR41-6]MBB1342000.1 TonB-dependent receptor [Pseudoalteromonas sp. SR45-6]MBB1367075.1 TonB-dependent receptor [Pseudoalteromonas sp. SR44-5]MBB1419478.1 TonB-dependent receptor [Pseudoalteromonas sp. SG44-1]MBB1421833.1 TonB-dependent receptor [Pseudoalteromonas sp. SG43-7]